MAGMQRVAHLFMDRLVSLQTYQPKLLELLVTGQAFSGLQQPINLNALADMDPATRRRTPLRRPPAITFADQTWPDASGSAASSSLAVPALQTPASLSSQAPALQTPASSLLAVPALQVPVEALPRAVSVVSLGPAEQQEPALALALPPKQPVQQRAKLETMLDMLHERDGDRRRAKQAATKVVAEEGGQDASTPVGKAKPSVAEEGGARMPAPRRARKSLSPTPSAGGRNPRPRLFRRSRVAARRY